MSLIVRGDDDSMGRKGVKLLSKTLLHFMETNKRSGDHIEITETLQPGKYKFTASEEPGTGHLKLDFTPGVES